MDKAEIICISSDDDENTEENKTNDKQLPVIKQKEDKCAFLAKVELSSSETTNTTNTNQKKRKISEVISENDVGSKNKSKVIVCEENSVNKLNSTKDSDELPAVEKSDEDKSLLKPKLVVKEKKSVFLVDQDIFPMFISLCLQKDRSEDMKAVVNKLKRRYEQMDPEYANSETFTNFLNEKRNDIMFSKHKLYVHIAEVMTEMKNHRKGSASTSINGTNCALSTDKLNVRNNSADTMCSNTKNNVIDGKAKVTTDNKEEVCSSMDRKVRMILKAMKKCEKYIKKLEEAEVDFEHENNSNYIKLEKFKHRMVELYNKYCELIGESADAGRQYLRPKHFSTTGIVSVDHAITSFINSKISKRKKLKKLGTFTDALIFPDYRDILECVTKCNELHNLGLDNKKQQQIAKKAFTELGEYLQNSRRNDYWDTFSLFLENKEDDPASKDQQLAEKLIQNKREGEKRLANIFEEYVKKQEEMKGKGSESGTCTEDEENEEDCAENEEDCAENKDDNVNNVIDNISDDVMSLSSDENKNEDEDGLDKSEMSRNKTDNNVKSSVKVQPDVGTQQKPQLEVNNKLKNSVSSNAKLKQVDSDVNVSKPDCKRLTEEKLFDLEPCDLNTSTVAIPLIPSDNNIPIEKTKEDEPTLITDKLTNEQPTEEDKPLLRVRSFAKLPWMWDDIQEKAGHLDNNNDLIDLTQESPKQNSSVHQEIRSRVCLETTVNKRRIKLITPGKNLIRIKTVTKNVADTGSKNSTNSNTLEKLQSAVMTSEDKSKESRTTRLSTDQDFHRKSIDNDRLKVSQTKRNGISTQVSQNSQALLSIDKQKQNVLKRPNVNVSSQSK